MCVTLSGLEKFFYFSRDFFFFNYFSRYFSIKNEIILLTISGELIKIESLVVRWLLRRDSFERSLPRFRRLSGFYLVQEAS